MTVSLALIFVVKLVVSFVATGVGDGRNINESMSLF